MSTGRGLRISVQAAHTILEGLHHMDRNMIDAASGGALGNITPAVARQLIENMASNSQQFGTRSNVIFVRGVHDVGAAKYTKKLESKIDARTTLEPTPPKEVDPATLQRKRDAHAAGPSTSGVTSTPSTSTAAPSIPLPFPSRVIPSKKMEEVDKEILKTFRKVEVKIPLLDAIK